MHAPVYTWAALLSLKRTGKVAEGSQGGKTGRSLFRFWFSTPIGMRRWLLASSRGRTMGDGRC